MENPEEAELGRYIEVLQARKKEMASGITHQFSTE